MSGTMRAAARDADGGPDVLRIRERERPEPGADDVLVRVAFAGLNRADALERAGRYGRLPPSPEGAPAIAGIEYAGTVESCGSRVRTLAPGDRVCGLVPAGAHAEYLVTHALCAARIPDGLGLREAAAVPEAYLTAHDALFARGGFAYGEFVLVHAVGSGVGLAATSLATAAGGVVFGTSRTTAKLERAREHGMRAGFTVDEAFEAALGAATGGRGVDVVLDFVGGPSLDANVRVLAARGRIVQIGTLAGATAELSLGAFMAKRATLVGTVLRTRELDERIALARVLERRLLPAILRGTLRVEIDRTFSLDDLADAHRYMEADANFGKIVIAVARPGAV